MIIFNNITSSNNRGEIMELYICHTYYHVLLTIMLSEKKDNVSKEIILSDTIPDVEKLAARLVKSGKFSSVEIIYELKSFKEIGIIKRIANFLFNRIVFFESESIRKLNFTKYNNIFVFHDNTFLGMKALRENGNVHLCEDGKRHYPYIKNIVYKRFKFKKIIKDLFVFLNLKYDEHGRSDRVKSYYITNKQNIVNWMEEKQINYINVKDLSDETIEEIKSIFLLSGFDFNENRVQKALILTQPLFQDGFVTSEKEQLDIYQKILNDLKGKYEIFIKPHPRDNGKYTIFESTANIIEKNFPVEVFNYTNITFDIACTIGSSSIYDNEFVREIKEYNHLKSW